MSDGLLPTPEDVEAMTALSGTVEAIGRAFREGNGSPMGLRMAAATMRAVADRLEVLADRWQENWQRVDGS